MVPSGWPSLSASSDWLKPSVVGELERLALRVGKVAQRRLYALALQAKERVLFHAPRRPARRAVERVGAAPLLAPDGVDSPPVHEREDPRARLAVLGHEARRRPPDGEERLLHRVLGQRLVAQDTERKPVRGAAVAVVELGERGLLRPRGQRDERFVGEVGELPVHASDIRAPHAGGSSDRTGSPVRANQRRPHYTRRPGSRREGEGNGTPE